MALLLLAPSAMVLTAGCGGPVLLMPTPNLYSRTPDNPFADVPAAFRTNTVDLLYVTDRKPEGDPAKDPGYGSGRSMSLAFGMTTVRIGTDVSWDELVAASRSARRRVSLPMSTVETHEVGRFPPVPTREVKRIYGPSRPRSPSRPAPAKEAKRDAELEELPRSAGSQEAADTRFKALVAERLALTPKKEVYVFIHGAWSDFRDPTYVMAGLWHFMGRCGVPVVYTWPSGGGGDPLRNYTYDRESSEFTIFHLKQFLRLLASCPGVEKVHILAHSRGTDTAISALRELAIEIRAAGGDTRKALKIGCFVLAAADMDLEVSTQRVSAERLMRVPEQMVLYVSPLDSSLGMADWLLGSKDRLGQFQAGDLTRRRAELLQHLPDIQYIDARLAGSWAGSHNYFHSHPAVSSDLILLLRDNRRPGAESGRPLASEAGGFWRIDQGYPAPAPGRPDERTRESEVNRP